MARQYKIPTPYTTSAKDGIAIVGALQMDGADAVLARLKPGVVAKLQRVGFFHHETFTKAELDSIPDDIWAKLAEHLG